MLLTIKTERDNEMDINQIHEKVVLELQKLGIILDNIEDVNLNDYMDDSLQFISFIVQVEQAFDIVFPNEELLLNSLYSLDGFCELIKEIREKR